MPALICGGLGDERGGVAVPFRQRSRWVLIWVSFMRREQEGQEMRPSSGSEGEGGIGVLEEL